MKPDVRGDPDNLTWAIFEWEDEAHGVGGHFPAGVTPEWPTAHVANVACPCGPAVYWDSEAAPRPYYEHRTLSGEAHA